MAGAVWLALRHPLLALVLGLAGLALAVAVVVWLGRRAARLLARGWRARTSPR